MIDLLKIINDKETLNIGVIGLGYVGLPIASKMSNLHNVIGFDLNSDSKSIKSWA